MNLSFSAAELDQFARLSAWASDYERLTGELELATIHLPSLQAEGKRLAEALAAKLPSEIIAGSQPLLDTFTAIRLNEATRAALLQAKSDVSNRTACLGAEIKRAHQEVRNLLLEKLTAAEARSRVKAVARDGVGKTPAQHALALLALCQEFGANFAERSIE